MICRLIVCFLFLYIFSNISADDNDAADNNNNATAINDCILLLLQLH